MTKAAVTFRDPQSALKLDCDALVEPSAGAPDLPSFLEELRITTRRPNDAPSVPLLVVTSGAWPTYELGLTAENRCRVVAHSPDPDAAWDIASWFHGRLLAFRGDADVVSYRYDGGPQRGTDPDYNTPIAAFTIRARMRPAIL